MVDLQIVEKKLTHIQEYLQFLKKISKKVTTKKMKKDFSLISSVAHPLQTIIQACIDVCTHIASDEKWELPGSSAQAFTIALRHGVISEKVEKELLQATKLRNIIVHMYDNLDVKILEQVVKTKLNIFDQFVSEVRKWLKKNDKTGRKHHHPFSLK